MHLASLGCRIALHANTSTASAEQAAQQVRQERGEAIVVFGDLAESATAEAIVRQVAESFGRIDIVVNAAAIWSPLPLEQVTAEELLRYFQINTAGSFLVAQAAGLRMVQQPSGGAIINIGDWATVRPYLDHAAYFPSKGAIETMTRSLAVELGHRNQRVRVNCIQPGPVLLGEDVDDDKRARIASSMLLGRVGTAEHIAHAVQFLCENDFITGVTLPIDGGRTVYADDGLQAGLNTG
jgi:pteridine reductase